MERKNIVVLVLLAVLLAASLLVTFHDRYFFHNLFSKEKMRLAPGQSNVTFGTDLAGGVQAVLAPKMHKQLQPKEVENRLEESADIIRNRLSRYGDMQPDVRIAQDNKIHILIPGLQDPQRVIDVIGETGTLQIFLLRNSDDHGIAARFQSYMLRHPQTEPSKFDPDSLFTQADFELLIADTEDLGNVKSEYEQTTRTRYIGLDIVKPQALQRMQTALQRRSGSRIAIVFSGDIQRILLLQKSEGQALYPDLQVIGGSKRFAITSPNGYTKQELQDYLVLLESRPLPLAFQLERRDYVYPSIGAETNKKMLYLILAALFMVTLFFYGAFGELLGTVGFILISLTVLIQVGVYAFFGLVITLPAIAGLLLSIGITIDAAVLVFEKIKTKALALKQTAAKEETFLARFKGEIRNTLEESTKIIWIVRLTDVIGAAVIIFYTSNKGPVAGFGTALAVGSVLSLLLYAKPVFVALIDFCSSVVLSGRSFRSLGYGLPLENSLLLRAFYALIRVKKPIYYALLVCMALSLVLVFQVGFNYGIDFTGGNHLVLQFQEPKDFGEINALVRANLSTENFELRELAASAGSLYNLRTGMEVSDAELVALFEAFKKASAENEMVILSNTAIGPELQKDELGEAGKSLLVILVVIWLVTVFLFLRAGLGIYDPKADNHYVGKPVLYCILALLHDVLVLAGLLILFRIELSAGIMSVIFLLAGYSINDSLVFLSELAQKQVHFFGDAGRDRFDTATQYVDDALRRVAVKILLTSLSAVVVLLPLVVIGNNELKDYGIAVIFGVIVGTLSTVFIVSVWLEGFFAKRRLASAN